MNEENKEKHNTSFKSGLSLSRLVLSKLAEKEADSLAINEKQKTRDYEEIEYKDMNLNYLINIWFDNIYR